MQNKSQQGPDLWLGFSQPKQQAYGQNLTPYEEANTRVVAGNLQVVQTLYNFIEKEVLPGTGVDSQSYWRSFSQIVDSLSGENRRLLKYRQELQDKIDAWHLAHKGDKFRFNEYKQFLKSVNYIAPEVPDFEITTSNVDDEVARVAGPQLVVPILNARFVINALNGRWGSLYDAVYGSDIISEENGATKSGPYNRKRGDQVIAFARNFLDQAIPLIEGSHKQVTSYKLTDSGLQVTLENGKTTTIKDQTWLVGYNGSKSNFDDLVFRHHGLHFLINFDRNSAVAKTDKAGVSDITVESALTTILDLEDSVAAVDAEDKVLGYRNFLGLIKGNLTEKFQKGGKTITRTMNPDRYYTGLSGEQQRLRGRALMFVRNVGHQMTNSAILDKDGNEVGEGIMDAMITVLIGMHDVYNKTGKNQNSTQGSIYIVKPKQHGPEEVAFTERLFKMVETALFLPPNTVKLGIMDEERRTSVNLKQCIYAAKDRTVFINTGFLDRTGDEIHTSMQAGPMERKADIKSTPWIDAYERNNVDIGLETGFTGRAQIGKGMWPAPDLMAAMVKAKIGHIEAGANCAWVPSPTAATLHAMHYHQLNLFSQQKLLLSRTPAALDQLLTIPLAKNTNWTLEQVQHEVDNNAQGILGYVVRWINSGVGCSKVPDINNIGLMEDRATLRISSQHITNWLLHGICSKDLVMASFKKMAAVVDKQNASDKTYEPMAPNFEQSIAFKASCALVFEGLEQLVGCTEPLLHKFRILKKEENEAKTLANTCTCRLMEKYVPLKNEVTVSRELSTANKDQDFVSKRIRLNQTCFKCNKTTDIYKDFLRVQMGTPKI